MLPWNLFKWTFLNSPPQESDSVSFRTICISIIKTSKGYSLPSNICMLEMFLICPLYSIFSIVLECIFTFYSCLHYHTRLLGGDLPVYSFIQSYLSLHLVYFKELWVYKLLSILPPMKHNYSSPF